MIFLIFLKEVTDVKNSIMNYSQNTLLYIIKLFCIL